jgi:hypothetical protein
MEAKLQRGLTSKLTAAALDKLQLQGTSEKKEETRRRRTKSRSRSVNMANMYDGQEVVPPVPPMPLSSEIDPREITRISNLSVESPEDRVAPIREVDQMPG